MATWQFLTGAWDRPASTELTNIRGRSLTFRRTEGASADFTIDGRSDQALDLVELVTDLHVYRDGVKLYRGRLGPAGDDLDADRHTTKCSFGDYRKVLERRFIFDNDAILAGPRSGDVAAIVRDVLDLTQDRPSGHLGITTGVGFPAGRTINDVEFSAGQSIAQAIDVPAKTNMLTTGFDWEVDAFLALNIFPGGRGAPTGEVLEYGSSVTRVGRTFDPATYATALRGNGSSNSGIAQTVEVPDLHVRPQGRWEAQVGFPDVNTAPVLNLAVARELEMRASVRPAFKVTARAGWWKGPGHVWLGDAVRLVINSGRVRVDSLFPVDSITIGLTDDGDEVIVFDLAVTFPPLSKRVATIEDRLHTLERN